MNCRACDGRRPKRAVLYGDEFCSRACAERTYGTTAQNQLSLKDPELRTVRVRMDRREKNRLDWLKKKARRAS